MISFKEEGAKLSCTFVIVKPGARGQEFRVLPHNIMVNGAAIPVIAFGTWTFQGEVLGVGRACEGL